MRNIEKLRNYFLGKDPQLKETMADNSLRLIGIEGKHFVLRTELLKRLQELRKHVDDTDEHLQDEIDDLIRDLASEENNRINADTTLQHNIDAEANTRSTNDGLLQNQISMLDGRVSGAEHDIDNLQDDMSNVYTKSEVNTITSMLQGKLTAGDNITINDENEISATDTTYDNFVGTTGIDNGQAGLVPAPQTSDMGKYLKADGTWATVGNGITPITDAQIRPWTMDDGLYAVPQHTQILYDGETSMYTVQTTENCIMQISSTYSGGVLTTKHWKYFTSSAMEYGNTTAVSGTQATLHLVDGGMGSHQIKHLWKGTQTEYDAIATKDAQTLYVIE